MALRTVANLESPVAMVERPGTTTMFAAERSGRVRVVRVDGDRLHVEAEPALDLRSLVREDDGERGLLGLAFDCDGQNLFVDYTDGNDAGASVIARYRMSRDSAVVSSRTELLRIAQPFANHNGGNLVTGPDCMLYAGFGDGGGQGDPDRRAQDLSDPLGKLLRLDPAAAGPASVAPADNPFVGHEGVRPEIWASGLRNPWRYSFDRATGDLWIGDVGGSEREEIDVGRADADGLNAARGANFGWSLREGTVDTPRSGPRPAGLTDPVAEYDHSIGQVVTGGFVYRGSEIPGLQGRYVFGDVAAGRLFTVDAARPSPVPVPLAVRGAELSRPVSFAESSSGRLYVISLDGPILRLEPA
ncbi:MAG: PQQ-dependent sugar dehydrogenase [Microthrixaceae bacterium]